MSSLSASRCLALGALLCVAVVTTATELPPGILKRDGTSAPALRLQDMDGNAFDLEESGGHWLFIHFWASWCAPCRKEMPSIARMAKELAGTSLEIVLVNTAESEDAVFGFLAAIAPDLMGTLLDRDGAVTERWEPRGLPSTFLVDPKGRIRYLVLGGRDWSGSEYLDFLRELVGRPTANPK